MNNIYDKEIKFIAIYARVSTLNQEEQKNIEIQIKLLEEEAIKRGYVIVDRYIDDGWSGDILERPELDRMRQDARDKKFDAVLVYDPDRLARKYAYQELVMDELAGKDIPIIFLTVSPPKDDMERAMLGMRGVFAEFEKAKIKERFRLGKLRKVKDGHILVTEALYGYTYIPNKYVMGKLTEHGYYVVNEDEARNVRMIFDWIANSGLTMRAVIKKLYELNIKPRRSKKGWSTSTLTTMLRHEGYIGKAHWGSSYAVVPEKPLKDQKYKKVKKTSRKFRPKEEWYIIPIPKIIEEDLFWLARAKLEANSEFSDRNKKNEYLLSGKIFCICTKRRCGCSPQGGKNLYYRCNDRIQSFPLPRQCKERGVNARICDQMVWEKLSKLMTSSNLLKSQLERFIDRKISVFQNSEEDDQKIRRLISTAKTSLERYGKAYADGLFEIENLRNYLTPIQEKIVSLEAQLERSESNKSLVNKSVTPSDEQLAQFTALAKKTLTGLNFAVKRAIVMDTVDKVVATQEKLQVNGYIPLNLNVSFCSKHRYCRFAECREVHII